MALWIQVNGTGAILVNLFFALQVPGGWKEEGNLRLVSLGLDTTCWRKHGQKSGACQYHIMLTVLATLCCATKQQTDKDFLLLLLPVDILFLLSNADLLTGFYHMLTRENVNELQQNHIKETERALAVLQEEMRKKEADYEEKLLLIRQQQTSKVRCLICCFSIFTTSIFLSVLPQLSARCLMNRNFNAGTYCGFVRFRSSICPRRGGYRCISSVKGAEMARSDFFFYEDLGARGN